MKKLREFGTVLGGEPANNIQIDPYFQANSIYGTPADKGEVMDLLLTAFAALDELMPARGER